MQGSRGGVTADQYLAVQRVLGVFSQTAAIADDPRAKQLGGALRNHCFGFDFCCIWHLEGFGSMENTPMGRADDLPTVLGIFKNDPNREASICFAAVAFSSKQYKKFIYQPKLRLVEHLASRCAPIAP